jgi:hypothetical protein
MEPLQTGKPMIDKLNLKTLEEYIELYPWYSAGYLELYRRLSDTSVSEELLSKAAPRLFSREPLYRLYVEKSGTTPLPVDIEGSISGEVIEVGTEKISDTNFILAGGDYFSKKEFENITLDRNMPLDRFIEDKPSLLRSALENRNRESSSSTENGQGGFEDIFDDSDFYTETLAAVYAEQGYCKRALEIYAKLILLYPEKSSYFASLVKLLKSKHNI